MDPIAHRYFPADRFTCYFEQNSDAPLIVASRSEIDLADWAKSNQSSVAKAVHEFGAIVFSGFNVTKENFYDTYTALTGMPPETYKGDTPRNEIDRQIYQSTAVANAHTIPLHQEVSVGRREDMPMYISFYCDIAPEEGTGQTLVGNAKRISEEIQALMPQLWEALTTKSLTYTARYLPKDHWRTKWIRWLNPSHATIEKRFGTENKSEVENKCRQEGLTCEWDGEWAVISRKGVPGTIDRDGVTLFCNQIHNDKLSPKLCGGLLNYILACIFLYPTSRSLQFDVQFDDGTPIQREDAEGLLSILEKHQQGRNWKKGDLMLLDNVSTMHGKTIHVGQREILVAMSGSVNETSNS